jgi:Secretion system C-terminal sorting domain
MNTHFRPMAACLAGLSLTAFVFAPVTIKLDTKDGGQEFYPDSDGTILTQSSPGKWTGFNKSSLTRTKSNPDEFEHIQDYKIENYDSNPDGGGGVMSGVRKRRNTNPTYRFKVKFDDLSNGMIARARCRWVSGPTGGTRLGLSIHSHVEATKANADDKWTTDLMVNISPGWDSGKDRDDNPKNGYQPSWENLSGGFTDIKNVNGPDPIDGKVKYKVWRRFGGNFEGALSVVLQPETVQMEGGDMVLKVNVGALMKYLRNRRWAFPNDHITQVGFTSEAYGKNNSTNKGVIKWTDVVIPDAEKATGGREAAAEEPGMEPSLTLSPNPTDGLLLVQTGEAVVRSAQISDASGRQVMPSFQPLPGRSFQVDVSRLATGVFLLKLETDKGPITRRFIRQ